MPGVSDLDQIKVVHDAGFDADNGFLSDKEGDVVLSDTETYGKWTCGLESMHINNVFGLFPLLLRFNCITSFRI